MSHQHPNGRLTVDKLIVIPPNSEKAVLKGISFHLEAGESLIVVGDSGNGKSSLGKAIVGIWEARSGGVRLDEIDIKQWNKDELGQHIGYLSQTTEMLSGTIAQNISRFTECDDSEIIEAAKLAGAHEAIIALEKGYDTILDSNASQLSAGQKQLVGLARAVFRNPSLVVLDEPNAHLDARGDLRFIDTLKALKEKHITTIVISHKLSIVPHLDKYLEIKFGQAAVLGPTKQLLEEQKTRGRVTDEV